LSSPSCPAGAKSCTSDDGAASCCPNAYGCQFDAISSQHYCCSAGTNCQSTIQNIPICADPNWGLYFSGNLNVYFCCLPGQVGILSENGAFSNGFGSCGDAGLSYPTSKLASAVAEPTGHASLPSSSFSSRTANAPQSTLITTPSGSPTSTSPAGAGGAQGSSSTTSPPPSTSISSTTNLSTGAIVGIAVGGVAFVALVGIIGFLCFRYGRRQSIKSAGGGPGNPTAYYPSTETAEKSKIVSTAYPAPSRSELEHRPPPPAELGEFYGHAGS